MKYKKNIIKKKSCRLCSNRNLTKLFNLCETPLANNLALNITSSLKSKHFPLNLMFCKNCKHVQLEHVVNEKKLFRNYLYQTGISDQFKKHFKNYAKEIKSDLNYNKGKILEIGSNDCTLLDNFSDKFLTVGVEPATNLWKKTKHKHEIINDFYNSRVNKYLVKKYKSFDVIIANNVFAHIDNLHKVFLLLKTLMNKTSIVIFEVSYLLDVIKRSLFDTIYHEHLDYHSIKPLKIFFNKLNLKIYNIKRTKMHGGSIRFYIIKKESKLKIKQENINKLLDNERRNGLYKISTYNNFYHNLELQKVKLLNFFKKNKMHKIYGYGAPAKAVTLIKYFDLSEKDIKLIIDDSSLKQNKFIPGTKIKIYNSEILKSSPAEIIIILAWNVYIDIINKLKKSKTIKFAVVPLPKLKIIKL